MTANGGSKLGRWTRLWAVPLALGALVATAATTTRGDVRHRVHVRPYPSGPNGMSHNVAKPSPDRRITAQNVTYGGGHVISHIQIVSVIWGSGVDATTVAKMPTYYAEVVNSSYMDWMSEYNTVSGASDSPTPPLTNQHIKRGSFLKQVQITPSNTSTNLADSDIQTELQAQISSGKLPMPMTDAEGGYDTMYFVHFPSTISISDPSGGGSCVQGGFCAYHGDWQGSSSGIPYAVIPDCGANACGATVLDGQTESASHEMGEAMTDTEVGTNNVAWYDQSTGEIGDYCAGNPPECPTTAGWQGCFGPAPWDSQFHIQALWSQRLSKCIAEDTALMPCSPNQATACAGVCMSDANCMAPTPKCDTATGGCVGCLTGADCKEPMPVCDMTSHSCRGCKADTECAAPTPKCNTTSGACVACKVNSDCTDPAKPTCDTANNTCRACMTNADCTGSAGGKTCATSGGNAGHCVACNSNTDCTAPQVCDPGTNTCVGCDTNNDCSGSTPVCNTGSHTCVAGNASGGDGGLGNGGGDGGNGNGNGNGSGDTNPPGTSTTSGCAMSPAGGSGSGAGLAGILLGLVAVTRRRRRS